MREREKRLSLAVGIFESNIPTSVLGEGTDYFDEKRDFWNPLMV